MKLFLWKNTGKIHKSDIQKQTYYFLFRNFNPSWQKFCPPVSAVPRDYSAG